MSTEHTGDYCVHKDKMCMTRAQATAAALRMGIMMAYRCPGCGHWHIAHKRRPLLKQKHSPKGRNPRKR